MKQVFTYSSRHFYDVGEYIQCRGDLWRVTAVHSPVSLTAQRLRFTDRIGYWLENVFHFIFGKRPDALG